MRSKKSTGRAKCVEINHCHDPLSNSVLFKSTVGDHVRDVVVAYIGTDVKIMDYKLLTKIQADEADVEVRELPLTSTLRKGCKHSYHG